MEMQYKMENGYRIPHLTLPEEPAVTGKYAMLRETYLMEQNRPLYMTLLTSGRLNQHLLEIQETAEMMLERQMAEQLKDSNLPEELKARNPMEWVGQMNNLRHSIEEMILTEVVFG